MDIFEACRIGDLDWLKQQKAAKTLGRLMRRDQSNTLLPFPLRLYPHEYAAANGHLEVLKWLVLESGQLVDLLRNDALSLRFAARNGHLDVVKWLLEESGRVFKWKPAIENATTGGAFEICKWLLAHLHPGDHRADCMIWVCSAAITLGDLNMVQWLASEEWQHKGWNGDALPEPLDFVKDDNWALMETAFSEQLHIAQWLVSESGQRIDVTFRDHAVLDIVSGRGYQDFVKWLLKENRRNGDSEEAYQVAISSAAKAGRMNLLKLIVEKWFGGKSLKKVFLGEDEAEAECWQYVESTREMQETLGLRSWKVAVKAKRKRTEVGVKRRV